MPKLSASAILVFVIILGGCSGNSNPTVPQTDNAGQISDIVIQSSLPVEVSERFPDGTPSGGQGLLGLYSLEIEPSNASASLVPVRMGYLTDTLESVDITNFLELAPCSNCVKLKSVSLDFSGNLVLEIGVRHPFDMGDSLKPITGRNRADLHVFNVEGIIVSSTPGTSFPGLGAIISGFNLLSADGYTDYLDSSLDDIFDTPATMHPYVLHFDDYSAGNFNASNPMGFGSVTEPPPGGNLVMPMGSDYDNQEYVFALDAGSMEFIYAVGCTYAVSSASKSQRFSPEYRIPQHNKKAASEVRVEIVNNDLRAVDTGSSAELEIKVLDINHGVEVGSGLDQMLSDSSVSSIAIEIPGVTASPVVIPSPVPTGGDGRDPMNPLSFDATITNSAGASEGIYTGIAKILDSYQPGMNSSPLLNGMDGIKRVNPLENPLTALFDINEFATYAVFSIDVALGEMLEACFVANPEEVRLEVDPTIQFDGSCSNDPNSYNIVSFQWDFDWDGDPAHFVADEITSIPTTNHTYTEAGTKTVALKVSNDAIPSQTSDIFSDNVIVHGWILPAVKLSDGNVSGTFMWFNDKKIAATSDGYIHVLVENFMTDYTHQAYYYMCDENGTVSSESLYSTNEIVDVGIIASPSDKVYAFYVKLNGSVFYRIKGTTGFDPEILAVTPESGSYTETASYAVNADEDIFVITAEEQSCPLPSQIYMALNEGSGFMKTYVSDAYRWIECSGGGGSGIVVMSDAVADSNGKFHMVWNAKVTSDASTVTNVYYAYYNAGVSPVTTISSDSYNGSPILRADADGNVWCAYMTNTACKMAIKPSANNTFNTGFTVVDWVPGVSLPHFGSFDINQANGEIMYVYDSRLSPSNEYYCFSKIFDTSSTQSEILNSLQFRIDETGTMRQWWPGVTSCADGHWYAIWDDQRNLSSPSAHGDLYFAMYY